MSQYLNLNPKGLFTYYNNLSEVTPGALLKATNTILDRDGIISPRRGIKYYGAALPLLADRAKQLMQYKDTLIRHVNTKLAFESGAGVFTNFSGDYTEVVSGERTKYLETKGNFYFTSSEGVKKISVKSSSDLATAEIINTGAPEAIGAIAVPNYSTPGFLSANTHAPYQVTWGMTDANNLFVEGVPSEIIEAKNDSPDSQVSVDLFIQIPTGVTSDYVFRIYRAQQSLLTSALNVTYNLVFEGNPTDAEVTQGFLFYNDFTSEDFRNAGEPLYTNATAEGISQANYRPPGARDLELFNGSVFYANTTRPHEKNITLLTTDDIDSSTDLSIVDKDDKFTIKFQGQIEVSTVTVQPSSLITDESFFLLNAANNERRYLVWFDKTGDNTIAPTAEQRGRIPIRIDVSNSAMTANDVGDAIEQEFILNDDFVAANALGIVTIENVYNGYADATADSTSAPTHFNFVTNQQGLGEDISTGFALISNRETESERVSETAKSIVNVFNSNQKKYIVDYTSITDSVPGLISVKSTSLLNTPFYITTTDEVFADDFAPSINVAIANLSATVSPAACTFATTTPHGYSLGDKLFLYNFASGVAVLNGSYIVTAVPTSTSYTINLTIPSIINPGFSILDKGASEDEMTINSLYFSKDNQPESVPLVNQILVGSADAPILRIKALRESLFIFKTDGLYRLSGFTATDFVVQLFDNTVILKCPDSVAILNNEIYCFSNQGVVKVSEVGKDVISKPIYNKLVPMITTNPNLAKATFGIAYESDRSYILFTTKIKSDTVATAAYRYNTDTTAWTEWDVSKTCAILKTAEDKLYFGSATANVLEQERKNFNRFDYADREIILSLTPNSLSGNVIKPSNFEIVSEKDVITQTQYVTIAQISQLLKKLELDTKLNTISYYPEYALAPGGSLSSCITAIVNILNIKDPSTFTDSHGNTSYVFNGTIDFASTQTQFNAIIDRLNQSTGVTLNNYPRSTGTVLHEAIVLTKDTIKKQFDLEKSPPFIQGPILVYKGITTEIEFVPQHGGDASSLKQVSTGTILLENRSFYSAEVGFNSDLSVNYDNVTISPISYGNWGDFTWGTGAIWGGQGDRAPLRTYIPAKKQRCRFIGVRFSHGIALQSYALYGLSLTYNISSERAYR